MEKRYKAGVISPPTVTLSLAVRNANHRSVDEIGAYVYLASREVSKQVSTQLERFGANSCEHNELIIDS